MAWLPVHQETTLNVNSCLFEYKSGTRLDPMCCPTTSVMSCTVLCALHAIVPCRTATWLSWTPRMQALCLRVMKSAPQERGHVHTQSETLSCCRWLASGTDALVWSALHSPPGFGLLILLNDWCMADLACECVEVGSSSLFVCQASFRMLGA